MSEPLKSDDFRYRQSGTTGQEILDPDGRVVAWTVNAAWAEIIVGALNGVGRSRPALLHQSGGQGPVEVNGNHGDRLG